MIGEMASQPGVSAILLFGSRARADHARGSDTDLLLVAPSDTPRHKSIGHLSMFFYPWAKLLADAENGDLFVCHIVREAKPIFDPADRLAILRQHFRLRSSYAREIGLARDLGWLLDRHAGELPSPLAVKRIIWCVRTILIARLAERGTPLFAPADLVAFAGHSPAAALVAERHQQRLDIAMRHRFRLFLLEQFGPASVPPQWGIAEFRALFEISGNQVGLRTIDRRKAEDGEADDYHV